MLMLMLFALLAAQAPASTTNDACSRQRAPAMSRR